MRQQHASQCAVADINKDIWVCRSNSSDQQIAMCFAPAPAAAPALAKTARFSPKAATVPLFGRLASSRQSPEGSRCPALGGDARQNPSRPHTAAVCGRAGRLRGRTKHGNAFTTPQVGHRNGAKCELQADGSCSACGKASGHDGISRCLSSPGGRHAPQIQAGSDRSMHVHRGHAPIAC